MQRHWDLQIWTSRVTGGFGNEIGLRTLPRGPVYRLGCLNNLMSCHIPLQRARNDRKLWVNFRTKVLTNGWIKNKIGGKMLQNCAEGADR